MAERMTEYPRTQESPLSRELAENPKFYMDDLAELAETAAFQLKNLNQETH